MLVAIVAFVHHRRGAETYAALAANLPDACRWADLQARVADKEREFESIRAELAQAQATIARKDEADEWLRANGPRFDEVREQLPIVAAKLEALQDEVGQLAEQRNALQGELAEGRHRRDLVKEEARQLADQVGKRRDELGGLERQLANAREEESRAKASLAELDAKLVARDAELRRAEDQLGRTAEAHQQAAQRLEAARAELLGVEGRLNALREEHRHHEHRLAELKQVSADKEKEVADLARREALLRDQLADVEGRHARAERQLKEREEQLARTVEAHQQAQDRLAAARADLHGVEGRLNAAREEHGQYEQRLAEVKRLWADAEKAVADLARREAQLRAQVADAEDRHAKALRQLEEREGQLGVATRQLAGARQELDQVRAEHERRKHEIEEAKKHFESLQKRIADSAKALPPAAQAADDDEKLAELWSPVLETPRGRGGPSDELQALRRTGEYLRDLGLHFPERTLRAFHTSLKSADVSPLVVLAGISGTGKSELPRRYAEGMGMHFLNIAVQPRWDSPQDMFGFYNYLENRYRATDLARALVQMDPFGPAAGRGWQCPAGWGDRNSRRDDVLLVLLDEMNLARVEYYFSEFLSRLETRRGVRKQDAGDRRKAEIGLEVGMQAKAGGNGNGNGHAGAAPKGPNGHGHAAAAGQPNMQLFVGTMNEDESTQTLSDKVVDRANVLRFGRPAQLARGVRRAAVTRPDVHLPFEVWRQWGRTDAALPTEVSDKVDRWIGVLNEAMHQIRRPFAFRTSSAMRTYVANYPDAQRYADAMADQVELKILPKFRGLDLTEANNKRAMQRIKDLLGSELEDQRLVRAIEECERQGQGEHQFTWGGVDRSQDGEG